MKTGIATGQGIRVIQSTTLVQPKTPKCFLAQFGVLCNTCITNDIPITLSCSLVQLVLNYSLV